MSGRLTVVVCVGAGLILSHAQPVAAQADVHARAIARASCQSGKHSDAVLDAKSAVEHNPDDLGPRMRLADALVDQGCYQEAVEILEAAQETFPRSNELSGKLRDVRSLVTEQTYIEGLTQAAESAKIARNQLRCTKLADLAACEDALRAKPDDVALLTAKADALMQGNHPADAAMAYRHASELKPGDDAIETKLASAAALVAKTQPPPGAQPRDPTPKVAANTPSTARKTPQHPPALASAKRAAPQSIANTAVAALTPPETKTYSNDAPPGQTN
jgi:cytochrome c-type biogenesis protein CcmH/NrfG